MDIKHSIIVRKVWGYEKIIANNDLYCGKILHLKKGYQCSIHYHKLKDETFYILSGRVRMIVDGVIKVMYPGDIVHLSPLEKHRFVGLEESEIIEISTHHEDDDSYRIEPSGKVMK